MAHKSFRNVTLAATLALPLVTLAGSALAQDIIKISVINNSGKNMTALYMSPPDKQTWGKNELEGTRVADREKVDFEWDPADYGGSEAGCVFDVRAEYEDGKSTDLYKIDVCKETALNFN
ncbi:hypothetical protein [Kamptonema formosum]|uniref:hypothetical protein n=1 Tax=Kamptonema formosum TaxID=331992 RepID=UPI0003471B2A|nr:hypothetical protein [Oscillatoria sp. PCC 10802]